MNEIFSSGAKIFFFNKLYLSKFVKKNFRKKHLWHFQPDAKVN